MMHGLRTPEEEDALLDEFTAADLTAEGEEVYAEALAALRHPPLWRRVIDKLAKHQETLPVALLALSSVYAVAETVRHIHQTNQAQPHRDINGILNRH